MSSASNAVGLRMSALVVALMALCAAFAATAAEYRGSYNYQYGGALSDKEKQEAELLALRKAVEAWIAEKNPSHQANYARIKSSVDSEIKDYLLDFRATQEQDRKNNVYRVTVLVKINEPKLLDRLINSAGPVARGQKKYISFLFVAREQASRVRLEEKGSSREQRIIPAGQDNQVGASRTVTTTDAQSRVVTRGEEKPARAAPEIPEDPTRRTQMSGDDQMSSTRKSTGRVTATEVTRSAATQDRQQTLTGTAVTREKDYQIVRKDQVTWNVTTTNEIDSAMGEVFTEANLLVFDAASLEEQTAGLLKLERFIEDYGSGMDVRPATRSDALRGLRQMEEPLDYFAIGTLDIDETTTDPVTGNVKIAVAVTGQIISIHERGAVVAKVGPETSFGEGNSPFVARNNALVRAAKTVASQLVAQLSAKGIR